jgi:hypothetical protein
VDQARQAGREDDAAFCHRFRANELRLWLSVIAYNLGNLWRRLTLPAPIGKWSLTSLQQRLVKTGGRLIKHARLLAVAGGEPSDAAAVRRHACKNWDAAGVAGGIMRAQFGAIFDETVLVWRGKCLPMRPWKGSFPGVTCSPEAKPALFGAAGSTVDQYRAKPLQREVVQSICELEQESQNRNSG